MSYFIWLKQRVSRQASDKDNQPVCQTWYLHLYIQPNAKQTMIVGEYGNALKIRLQASPVDGKANAALLAWLSTQLKTPKQTLQLIAGELSRQKIIAYQTTQPLTATQIAQRLLGRATELE